MSLYLQIDRDRWKPLRPWPNPPNKTCSAPIPRPNCSTLTRPLRPTGLIRTRFGRGSINSDRSTRGGKASLGCGQASGVPDHLSTDGGLAARRRRRATEVRIRRRNGTPQGGITSLPFTTFCRYSPGPSANERMGTARRLSSGRPLWAGPVGASAPPYAHYSFSSRNATMTAIACCGCSSMIQWPELPMTALRTLAAAKPTSVASCPL